MKNIKLNYMEVNIGRILTEQMNWILSVCKNRRGAGKSDAEVKSNRYSLSFDYEYKPTEDLTVTSGYNQQKFRRNFTQNNKPYLTFLSSEWVEDMFGIPDGMNADLVIKM